MTLIPEQLKHPWRLVPFCIFSLALGMLLWFFILLPGLYPDIHERMLEHHFTIAVGMIGTACIALPIILLRWCIKNEQSDCC